MLRIAARRRACWASIARRASALRAMADLGLGADSFRRRRGGRAQRRRRSLADPSTARLALPLRPSGRPNGATFHDGPTSGVLSPFALVRDDRERAKRRASVADAEPALAIMQSIEQCLHATPLGRATTTCWRKRLIGQIQCSRLGYAPWATRSTSPTS